MAHFLAEGWHRTRQALSKSCLSITLGVGISSVKDRRDETGNLWGNEGGTYLLG